MRSWTLETLLGLPRSKASMEMIVEALTPEVQVAHLETVWRWAVRESEDAVDPDSVVFGAGPVEERSAKEWDIRVLNASITLSAQLATRAHRTGLIMEIIWTWRTLRDRLQVLEVEAQDLGDSLEIWEDWHQKAWEQVRQWMGTLNDELDKRGFPKPSGTVR